MSDITLTFPDGSKRSFARGITGKDWRRDLQVAGQEDRGDALDGKLADLADPIERRRGQDRLPHRSGGAGADPARRGPRHGRGGAGVVARHTGDDRPGDRERLLLRFRQGGAVPSRRLAAHREQDARDHRAQCALHQGVLEPDKAKDFFRAKGELFKIELVDAIPQGEDLKIYNQGDWLDLCRGPHMTSTGQIGKAFKLTIRRLLLARRRAGAEAAAHLRHGLGHRAGACGLSQAARGSREARPPQARPRDGSVPLPGGRAGLVFWHPKGWALFQKLIAYMRRRQNADGYAR